MNNLRLDMTFVLEPELGVPLCEEQRQIDLKDRAGAAASTALELAEHGLDVLPNKDD